MQWIVSELNSILHANVFRIGNNICISANYIILFGAKRDATMSIAIGYIIKGEIVQKNLRAVHYVT